jgi:hypothetical protein
MWRIDATFFVVLDTNNAFVTMQLGKDKFQTSVAKEQRNPQWGEECEL